eukprot:2130530-Prymnesium_polylepis.2
MIKGPDSSSQLSRRQSIASRIVSSHTMIMRSSAFPAATFAPHAVTSSSAFAASDSLLLPMILSNDSFARSISMSKMPCSRSSICRDRSAVPTRLNGSGSAPFGRIKWTSWVRILITSS